MHHVKRKDKLPHLKALSEYAKFQIEKQIPHTYFHNYNFWELKSWLFILWYVKTLTGQTINNHFDPIPCRVRRSNDQTVVGCKCLISIKHFLPAFCMTNSVWSCSCLIQHDDGASTCLFVYPGLEKIFPCC